MNILVVHGSKMGGTAGIADVVAVTLRSNGHGAAVEAAETVRSLEGYDAVVVGGALYATRWRRSAARFVKRHAAALRARPVWFFSSGPLDDSARDHEIPPTRQVARLMERVGARGHATFGGRLPPDAKGFPARAMAKDHAGDWRDFDQVRAWAASIAEQLTAVAHG
ncbi:MAG: flavodoxin domain-containing protein [Acidimicrobiia bacterium]